MSRAGVSFIVLAAVLTTACGGAESVASSPTGPSSTTPASSQPQPSCMPSAPGNLRVTQQVGTAVAFAWNSVSNATEYLVLVGKSSGNSGELFTNTTQTQHTDTFSTGTHYARVQAKNTCGTSGSSNEVEFFVQ